MRILMVTNNWIPYSGGVVSSIDSTVQTLRSMGHAVDIVTLGFDGEYSDPAYVHRVPSLLTFRYKQNPIAVPWNARPYIDYLMQNVKPHIVHIHHPFVLGPMAACIAKTRGIPVLFTYHSLYEKYTHYVWPMPHFIAAYAACKKSISCANAVDHLIVPSNCIAAYVRMHGVKKNLTILPSSIAPCFYTNGEQKRLALPLQLVYVGRFVDEKNITFLFDAVARLSISFIFTLVGYGYALQKLQKYAYQHCGLTHEQVQFVIRPPKERIAQLYAQSHLKLFASQTETQGLALAEAMASGTPVIALSGSGVDDIVCSGVNGYRIYTRDEMVNRIKQIVNNASLYQSLSEGARATAHNYTPHTIGSRLETLYQTMQIQYPN